VRLEADDIASLQPIIASAVRLALQEIQAGDAKLGADRLAYSEAEAAALLGVARHVLRDARLRKEIRAKKIGKGWRYSRAELARFIESGGD
jgi:excisionase family DNA binding protein